MSTLMLAFLNKAARYVRLCTREWFAHIAELKSRSSKEPVPEVNASHLIFFFLQVVLTATDGFKSPFPP